jgi:hypothetical protein
MGFLFNRLGFFMSDIISPFVRLIKLDIHPNKIQAINVWDGLFFCIEAKAVERVASVIRPL